MANIVKQELLLSQFDYDLPEERIAKYPLEDRAASKLLHYQNGAINDAAFRDVAAYLPTKSLVVFNNTKVIPARLYFRKDTGALIEIFLLTPVKPTEVVEETMSATGEVVWECVIGNLKKWKEGTSLSLDAQKDFPYQLKATLVNKEQKLVMLSWKENVSFSEVVTALGNIPLPPYLNREAEESDVDTYQTVYSKKEGAVAAPTAGLHFTDEVLAGVEKEGHQIEELTLHVSAGTFLPVKTEKVDEHKMHEEQIIIEKSTVKKLAEASSVVVVGTTSMRTLESLYWFALDYKQSGVAVFDVQQERPYQGNGHDDYPSKELFQWLYAEMEAQGLTRLMGKTSIFIKPGYDFKVCDGLITNFHQPKSTLLMLISAFVGKENVDQIYDHALKTDYRFLSYGDSSLLIPK